MKLIQTSGKRKSAVARATLKKGAGNVRINRIQLDIFEPKISRLKLREPLLLAEDVADKVDISVNVYGGGQTAQADAARLAIAKALLAHSKSSKLEKKFKSYDSTLLVADVRRKETSKPNRLGKARSKRQKSYR